MQKKKNIRLSILLLVLIVLTVITYAFKDSGSSLDIDKNLFAYTNTTKVNKVELESLNSEVELSFKNNGWLVNDKYEADPQRISVLFAIAQQVTVRRKASNSLKPKLDSLFTTTGVKLSLYDEDNLVKQFLVSGDEVEGLTYMKEIDTDDYYLVEIPGYRSYLAALFQLDGNGWRNPIVFDISWSNLQAVQVKYLDQEENDFNVIFDKGNYGIEGLVKSDSLKLIDFLDNVSLLYVNDYFTDREVESYSELSKDALANINIQDVGKNNYTLTIYNKIDRGNYLVKIDSSEYAIMQADIIKKVMKPNHFLVKEIVINNVRSDFLEMILFITLPHSRKIYFN